MMEMTPQNSTDWVANWQSSVAVKITGTVLYVMMMVGFAVALFLLHDLNDKLAARYAMETDAVAFDIVKAASRSSYSSLDQVMADIGERSASLDLLGFSATMDGETVSKGDTGPDSHVQEAVIPLFMGSSQPYRDITLRLHFPKIDEAAVSYRHRLLLITGAITLCFGFFLTWVILRTVKPAVGGLMAATKAVTAGELSTRIAIDRRDEFGVLAGFFNKMLDRIQQELAEREQAEEALRESNNFIRTMVDSMKDGIAVVDAGTFHILGVNRAFAAEYGVREEEVVGKTCYEVTHHRTEKCLPPDDLCPFLETLETGNHASAEHFHFGHDGRRTVAEVTVSPIKNHKGEITEFVHISRDITQRKLDEEKLRVYAREVKDANEEMKSFTYIVSHDLRAPLVSIKGFSCELEGSLKSLREIFADSVPLLPEAKRRELDLVEDDLREALSFIGTSITRMDGLINNILALSRLGRKEMTFEPVEMGEVTRKILQSMAHQIEKNNVSIKMGVLPQVTADKVSMEQVMGNLIDNALKYLVPGQPGELHLWAENMLHETVFHVRDNGCGIVPADHGKIFEIFQRSGKQAVPGEGMGLAYVKTLVRRHGGRIWCDSEPGQGATFSFSIRKDIATLREDA